MPTNDDPAGTPGKGANIYPTAKGKKVAVINLMGRLFMDPLDDPFQQIEQLLNALGRYPDLGRDLVE